MADLQPVPGAWYTDAESAEAMEGAELPEYEPDLLVAYLPSPWGDWFSRADLGWLTEEELKQGYPNLVMVYNPHPPTRTEWQVEFKENPNIRVGLRNEEDGRIFLENAPLFRLMSRQVTETEWQEVDEKETGDE